MSESNWTIDRTLTNPTSPRTAKFKVLVNWDWERYAGFDSRLAAALQPFEFRNLPFDVSLEARVDLNLGPMPGAILVATMVVLGRDPPHRPTKVKQDIRVAFDYLENRVFMEHAVFDLLRGMYDHELRESFHVNGVRVLDPHAREKGG